MSRPIHSSLDASFSPIHSSGNHPAQPNLLIGNTDQESQTLLQNRNKSPVKYNYLETQRESEQRRQWKIFWLQCFAMFIFIYASTCSKDSTGLDLHFFVGIMIAIPICAQQTGANLNPAVSLSMTFKATADLSYHTLLWIYVKAQILGAILAMLVAVNVNDVYREPVYPFHTPQSVKFGSQPYSQIARVILSEGIGMTVLILVILYGTGPYSFISSNGAKYFYIGVFVYIGRKFAAASGNQINLALTLSQAFVGMLECNFIGFSYILAWVVGDALGVYVAALIYLKLVEPTRNYLERHENDKVMGKLELAHQRQMRQKQQGLTEKGEYYKKLSYF